MKKSGEVAFHTVQILNERTTSETLTQMHLKQMRTGLNKSLKDLFTNRPKTWQNFHQQANFSL